MSAARKLLILSGIALAAWGMFWGLAYAVFFEHQILDAMGGEITTGFVNAAQRNLPAARAALAGYAHSEFNYVRQVDVHSHWIGLAMVLIVLGIVFDRVNLDARLRWWLALMLAVGSAVFPLGVILQTLMTSALPMVLAVAGAGLVIVGMAAAAWGFARAAQPAGGGLVETLRRV